MDLTELQIVQVHGGYVTSQLDAYLDKQGDRTLRTNLPVLFGRQRTASQSSTVVRTKILTFNAPHSDDWCGLEVRWPSEGLERVVNAYD